MYISKQDMAISEKIMTTLFEEGFINAITWHKDTTCKYDPNYYNLGYYEWMESHRDLLKEMHIHLSKGETKAVIVSDELSDWVIKVGFLRETCPNYVRDDRVVDFCGLEEFNYKLACIRGVEEYFAEIHSIGEYAGVKVYLQEKIETDSGFFSDKFYDYVSSSRYSDHSYSYSDIDIDDIDEEDRILAIYEGDEPRVNIDKLINFINEREINDLHDGNWGITKDDRYVIFDFSGYC